jgi:hypothetical protein
MRAMIRGIDHLVIACVDPDAAASELTDALGLAVTGGGRHESGGTRNRIAWLADGSYLELIGIDDRDAALGTAVGAAAVRMLDDHGGGLATFALAVDDLEVTVRGLRAAASALSEPVHGSRTREDGELVEWWVSVPSGELGPSFVPFLIQHAMVGAEWGHAALAERAAFAHPIGSPVVLARIDLATDDPPSLAARYHDELGLDVWAVSDLAVCTVGPHVIRLVPAREMDVPAVVTIGAQVDAPRTINVLGIRFDVERVEVVIPATPAS